MNNFTYCNPVKMVFGKGAISELASLLPADTGILLLYGGGSIKSNGVYDQVVAALKGFKWAEFGGIEPNPSHETCMKAVEKIKAEGLGFILAVGGGSVLDAAKYIAAACKYTQSPDPWDILAKHAEITAALPLGSVLTLPATGSEMNYNSVISRKSTQEKLFFGHPLVYPKFSILDPQTTFSLPLRQTVNGIVDTFVHVAEQYATYPVNSPLQDRQAEAVILTLLEESPKVLKNPNDYDARANLMWAATNGLNGLMACGIPQDWATHMIGHELTAFYGIDHGQSLAVVLPALWRHQKASKQAKLAQLARRAYGTAASLSDLQAADEAIKQTEKFFHSLGMKTRLSDYGIDAADAAKKISERKKNDTLGENGDITAKDMAAILMDAK